jgi:hypothetical protein
LNDLPRVNARPQMGLLLIDAHAPIGHAFHEQPNQTLQYQYR